MPKLEPPKDPRYKGAEMERAGVFKCDASGNAFVGIIWILTKGERKQKVFELVHGPVGGEERPEEVLKIARTKCVGSYVPGKLAARMWNAYFQLREGASNRKVWARNWQLISEE